MLLNRLDPDQNSPFHRENLRAMDRLIVYSSVNLF